MNEPTLTFHGAARTVTGACFELAFGERRILVDCGLFQGPRGLGALNREAFRFDAHKIDAVMLTHAHIDHSGLLPRLVRDGFKGDIWCTGPTADLLGVMLPDAGRIQEGDADRRNRRADRRDEAPASPLYTEADAVKAAEQARTIVLETWFEPAPGIRARFWNAGHILGSASVEVEVGGSRLLFSGDIGPDHKAFHADPDAPNGFDHIICESTYGDRDRETVTIEQRRRRLEDEVKAALVRGGNLVVPVFAVERTQELLLDLATLINQGGLPHTNIFIDSPMASRVTRVFGTHAGHLEDLGSGEVFRHPAFHFVEDVAQSIRLNDVSGAIILSASGMCEAGRIKHHLLHNLPRSDSTLLFVGYQAAGTLGRIILEGAQRVRISGREVAVRAQIRRIDSYSAHADRTEILEWLAARAPIRGSVFLTHGETPALEALRRDLQSRHTATTVTVPEIGERYAVNPGAPAKRVATGRTEMRDVLERDWQNDYADLSANLKSELRRIADDGARKEAIRRMTAVLAQYRSHVDNKTRR